MSFASLKGKKSNQAKLKEKIEQESGSGFEKDTRKWKLGVEKDTEVGSALVRFLPRYDENGEIMVPWVTWKEFSFKTPAGRYWERSLVTIGEEDPVANLNKAHWATITDKDGAEAAEARKRNVHTKYIANIVVLKDPKNPDNEGKVFLYEFGNGIKEKLEKAWYPEYEDQEPLEFFDWDEGANFRIRSKKGKNGWRTYEDSAFEGVSALANGDEKVQEAIFNKAFDLNEFESKDNYKEYDVLEKQMIKVLGKRYVCKIMGEEYTPETAAAAGESPYSAPKEEKKQEVPKEEPMQEDVLNTAQESSEELKVESSEEEDVFANLKLD